ncbi:MAG: 7TM diverse intracellular signaling domain-containing protein [Cytophagaceae bacterium]
MKYLIHISYVFILLLVSPFSFGQENNKILIYDGTKNILEYPGTYFQILEDPSDKLTIDDVRNSDDFQYNDKPVTNLGVSSSTFWIKFDLIKKTDHNLFLEIAYPILDLVEVTVVGTDGIQTKSAGEFKKFGDREFNHQNYIFSLDLTKNDKYTLFLKVKSKEQILLPIIIGTPEAIFEGILYKDLFFGIYIGIILVMFFYNLFLYYTIKDITYIYYCVYILSVGMVQACLQGYTFRFLWPNHPEFTINSTFIFSAVIGITPILFQKAFLQTKVYVPKLNKGLNIFIGIYAVYLVLFLAGFTNKTYILIQVTAMMLSFYMLYVAFVLYRKKHRTAKFFLVAWTIFLIGVFIYALKDIDILPYNNITFYTMPFGSAVETILLSFALADRIKILQKEKEDSQLEALKMMAENERLIKEQNIQLEAMVERRTEELKSSNFQLSKTLKNLKETQAHLVNSEKMASLGQLTAGIAHEINNPINFVTSSINPLKRDIQTLLELLNKYEKIKPEDNINELLEEINRLKEDIEFDYVKEEIDMMLKGISEGAGRTAEIVKGLRSFSRLDEDDLKKSDIIKGIQSTLVLLRNTISPNISIIEDYENIPEIECYPGKLNQVFMNMINNAIQAINAKKSKDPEQITINLRKVDENVVIRIKDTGIGMSKEIQEKIFEPFFTTKKVGEGTGLGLSIVYSIIQTHHGELNVISEPGKGAEFILSLPISISRKNKTSALNGDLIS